MVNGAKSPPQQLQSSPRLCAAANTLGLPSAGSDRRATHSVSTRRLSDLPESAKALVRIMRELQFGRFENLILRNGEPYFDPPPVLIRVSRLGVSAVEPSPEPTDWTLTLPVVELLDEFARIRDGLLNRLEFRHGLPVLLETRIPARPESSSDMSRDS